MGMTGKELLENYKKKKQENNVSSEETTQAAGTKITGTQLLDKYYGRTSKTEETKFTFSESGKTGWQKYLDDEEAKKNVPKYDANGDGKEAWWETFLGLLGEGNVDTTLPTAGVTQTINDLKKDDSYKKPRNDWNDEQRDAFGQFYLESPAKAYAYAEETNKKNNEEKEKAQIQKIQESATSSFGAGLGHTLGAIATAPLGLADYLTDLAYANAGREIGPDGSVSPFEYSQAVTGGISEHLNEEVGTLPEDWWIVGGKGLGDLYGLGTSIAQSMASAYTLGPAGTLVSYFGQGAAAGVDDAIARGASDDQALLYGAALGTLEGVAEMVGIDNLFKLGSASTVKGLIKNVLKQAGAEGGEELFTAVTSEIADRWIMADKSNFNILVEELMAQGMSEADAKKKAFKSTLGDIAFDTIAGTVSGSVSGGIHSGVQTAITNADAKANYSGQAQDMVSEAIASEDADTRTVGEKYQKKLNGNKKLSGWNINHLLEITDTNKMKTAVEARLKELGETGDVSKLADAITKQAMGLDLTTAESRVVRNSKYGYRVATEVDSENVGSGNLANKWAESIGTKRINTEAYNRGIAKETVAEPAESKSVTENAATEESAVESEISAPVEDAKKSVAKATMSDNEGNEVEAKVAKITSVEGGEATLELEGGETVRASDVDFGDSGIGFVYRAATEMVSGVGGFNVDAANLMVKAINPNISTKAADLYVAGFNEAYRYGAMGYPVAELAKGGVTSKIGVKQRELAYNLGRAFGEGKVTEKQANIDNRNEKAGQKASGKGKVYFDGSAVGKNLTERQRASLKGLRVIAEGMGVNIHIFESTVGKDGKRQGANGWYDPAKKEIHLDLHAGDDGNGVMLFTASHELTHHIREVAPAKFKIFADALLEEYTKNGVSLDELISRKLETLEANGRLEGKTREQAYDLAYEEVVADAAESMLVDSNAIEALSRKIQAKDKSLWETIKDFIAKLVARIKAAYKGLDPDSREGKLVREMADSAERLRQLWVDALLEASESNTEQTLGESGIIVNSKTDSASLMSVRDLLTDAERKKVSKALAERFGVTQSEANEWLKAETSLASLILNPKYSQYLDYTADPNEEAIKSNSDYPQGTVDFSNICKKRRDFTEVMNRVLRNFPNHVFAATDLAKIRTIMEEEGMEVACAICYVEDRRQLDSVVAQDFIDSLAIYREGGKIRPDGKPFNANQLKAFKLIEGDSYTPSIYELISLEGRNSLKAKNPAMEEAWVKFNNARGMQSVRLLLNDAEYKRQILKYSSSVVKRKNDLGGLRIYSFSDAEMFHLIDIIQVITDSATVGLSLQGYTKVNEYARAVKDTGEKLNRSLIPKGDLGYHMENGKVVLDFDTVEGIDINHPDFFDNIDNPNIGNIVIGINATQIKAAMTSKFIDQIIPFHTGQSNEVLGEKGIATWDNYKDFQSERDAKTKKKSSHQINIYTEVINAAEAEGHPITNKVEFVNKFLEVCRENNLIPRFSDFLNVDENGNYVYTEGYHKFLVDFKTFDPNTGEYLPQMPVKPIFDNEYITKLLTDYVESQKVKDAEVAKAMPKVLDRITKEIVKPSGNVKYSDRDSLGNELSEEQQEFFKDSKVRDKKGNLMVLYHGTTANFNTFKKGDVGFHFGTKGAARGRVGFGKNVVIKEVYLNITNPIVFDEDLGSWDADFRLTRELYDMGILTQADAESVLFTDDRRYRRTTEAANKKLASVLLEKGYDGIAYSNTFETQKATTSYIVFNSNQAKEITNKAPTSNPDIRYSDRDSLGNKLSEKQKEFFKDSKARDEDGNLLVLYHGTSTEQRITTFKTTEGWRTGLWLSTDHETAVHFARAMEYVENDPSDETKLFTKENSSDGTGRQGVYELYANVKNPLIVDAQGKRYWEIPRPSAMGDGDPVSGEEINAFALENGYDGVIINDVVEGSNRLGTDVIVFLQNQVKYTDNLNPTEGNDIRYSDRVAADEKQFNPEGKTLDEQLEDILHTSESFDGRYLYIGRFTSDFIDMVKPYVGMKDLPVAMNYRDAYLSMENKEHGKYKGTGINYHNLGKEGLKSAIESFGSPEQVLLSKKEGKVELVLQGVDKKGNKLLSIVALNTNAKNAKKYIEAHIVTSIYGKRSIDRYVSKAAEEGRLIYNKKEESAQVNPQVQYEGIINANSSVDSIAQDTEFVNSKFSDRNPDSYSNRSLLAGALESAAQNDIEKQKLAQYKQKIGLINSEEQKLHDLREQIKELSFKKGPRDTEAIKKLQFEANQAANRINTYDKQLLNLESTKALKGVLEREKALARKRDAQKYKEALERYREKSAKTQRELMDRYQESRKKATEGRNKTEIRHKIKSVVSDLNKLLLHPTKDQHVPIGLQLPVAEALDAINMDTMNAEERVAYYNNLISKSSDPDEIEMLTKKRDFFEYRDANFKERITALKNAYAEFKESDDPLIKNAHNEAIEDLIKNTADAVGNKSLKDMSLEQLDAVHNMYKAILATVRNSNKMFKEGRQETVTENSESVKVQVKEVGGHQDRVLKLAKFFKKFGWDMLKPVTAMKVIGSKTFEKLFNNVRAGEDTWAVDVNEAKEFYEGVANKYGFKNWDFKKMYSFKDSRGEDFSISLEQIMSLYAYSKRDQADKHLEFGGFIFDDAIEVTEKKLGIPFKYEVNDANPYRLRKEHILAITDALTTDQKSFIDEMQTYLSDVMGAKGNEVSLAMYDIKLYNEKNYFPLKTSRYFREFDPEKSGTPRIKNSGFSKKTVPQAGNPIVLSNFMDVWAGHVNDMSMYHSFVLPLEDFMRVYNYSTTAGGYDSVQQYIKNAYGSQANQYIERLMDDLNGGARVDSSAGVINKGLSLFKKAAVFASASVVVQQPSAIARASAYINPKYFAGKKVSKSKHKESWAELKKYAPVAVIKEMGYFDTGVGRSTVEWIKGNQTWKDKMDDALSKAPAKADELTWVAIWNAVKRETAHNNPTLKTSSEEFLKLCGERFTEAITNTQVYDSVLSRSGMMRSKDTGMKMATAFMAEPTTAVNMMVDGIIQGKRGNKKFTAATVGAVSSSIILNSILVALVYAARDDDEDETYVEKYTGSITTELIDGFNPLTYVPFVKDIWSIAQGYDVERSDMSVVSKLWESIEGLFKEDKSGLEKVLDVTGSMSSLFGIPLKNIIREAKGMYNLAETLSSGTQTTGAGVSESVEDAFKSSIPLWDRMTDTKSNADRLFDAIISGDRVQIERIKGRYKDEKAIEYAMRQALRENDPRIKEAAQARYVGDISKYTRIAKSIIAERKFSQDTIVAAINAELSAIKRGEVTEVEETEEKEAVTSIYSSSDISSALDSGDTNLALEIIADLIETKVANGMEEKNAKSSLRSSMTSYWKLLYKAAYQRGDTAEMARIRKILYNSGLYGSVNDVVKTAQDWLKD